MTWLARVLALGIAQSATPPATDDRGHFAIELAGSEPVLVFALSGFETREWILKSASPRTNLKVTLSIATVTNEVVVHAPVVNAVPDVPQTSCRPDCGLISKHFARRTAHYARRTRNYFLSIVTLFITTGVVGRS